MNADTRNQELRTRNHLTLKRTLRYFLIALRDFIFPPVCLGCTEHETGHGLVCPQCLEQLERAPLPSNALPALQPVIHLRALGHYRPPFSNLVHELKYRNRRSLAPVLGKSLAGLLMSDGMLRNAELLVPVPLHPARLRERGYNQSQLLAEQIAQASRIPAADSLRRVRNTRAQVRLDDDARQKNMAGAFALRPGAAVAGKKVILIDDVATTGATLSSAAQALKDAGAREVLALVVARAR
jgi:ComF family protein